MSTRWQHLETTIQLPTLQCHIINHQYLLLHVNRRLAVHQSQLKRYHHSMGIVRRQVPPLEMATGEVAQWVRQRRQRSQNHNRFSKLKVWINRFLQTCRLPHRIIHQISTPKSQKIRWNPPVQSIQLFNSHLKFKMIWASMFDLQNWLDSIQHQLVWVIYRMHTELH